MAQIRILVEIQLFADDIVLYLCRSNLYENASSFQILVSEFARQIEKLSMQLALHKYKSLQFPLDHSTQ